MWVKSCKFTDDKADNRAFSRHLRFIGHKKSSMRERLRADIRDEKEREKSMPAQRAKVLGKNK
jgi:hypothetical protein